MWFAIQRRRPGRAPKLVALGVCAVLVACALVYAGRWRLFGRTVRNAARAAIGDLLRAEVHIGEATGSIISWVELRDVRFFSRKGSPLAARGTVERLRVSWSPFRVGRISSIEIEGVVLALRSSSDPPRPWDEALADVLGRLDMPPAVPELSLADVRLRIGDASARIAEGRIAPRGRGFEAWFSLHDDGLPHWPARAREVRLRVGGPEAALEVGAFGIAPGGAEGGSLRIGRSGGRGVRLMALATAGVAPEVSFAGRIAPEGGAPAPSVIAGMLKGTDLPAARVAGAAGLRGFKAGAVSFEAALSADLRRRTLVLDVTATASSPIVYDTGLPLKHGRARLGIGSLSVLAHAEGPIEGGPDEWLVAPLDGTAERVEFAGVRLKRMDVISRLEAGRLTIKRASIAGGVNAGDALELAGAVDPFTMTGDLAFVMSVRDLAPYLSTFAPGLKRAGPFGAEGRVEAGDKGVRILAEADSAAGRLAIEGEPGIDVAWERLDATLAYGEGIVALSEVRVRGGPGGLDYAVEATVVPEGLRGRWKVTSSAVRAGPDTANLTGHVGPGMTADLDVDASIGVPPKWLPEGVASLVPAHGRARFVGKLDVRPGTVEARGNIDAAGLDIAGARFETASAQASVRRSVRDGGAAVLDAELRGLMLESDSAGLSLATDVTASARDGALHVDLVPGAVTFRGDEVSLPELIAFRSGTAGKPEARLEPFDMQWRGLTASVDAELADGGFRASLSARTDDLARVAPPEETGLPEVAGAARLDAYFAGSRDKGWGVVQGEAEGLAAAGFPLGRFKASALFEWPGEASSVTVSPEAEIEGPVIYAYLSGTLPLGRAREDARVDLAVEAEARGLPALLPDFPALRREVGRAWNSAELEFRLAGPAGDPRGVGWVGILHEAGPMRAAFGDVPRSSRTPFTYADGVFSLAPSVVQTPWGEATIGGDVPLRLSFEPYPSLAAGGGAVTLGARIRAGDLASLAPFMPKTLAGLDPSGRFSATARLEGAFPHFAAAFGFELRDGSLTPPSPVAKVDDISLDATLREARLEFDRIEASMGHGALKARGGVSFDGGPRAGFDVEGRDVLLVGGDALPVRARADLDLRIDATPERTTVTGAVAVTSASWSAEFPSGRRGVAPQEPADALAAIGVDLRLAPEGGVALPGVEGLGGVALDFDARSSGDVRIENSLVGAFADFRVRVRGTAESPSASGMVSSKRGEVRVFPGVFLPIDEFRLDLPPQPGAEPGVVFRSSATSGLTRVHIGATGPLRQPVVTLHSEPPYPQEDLVMLLAFGQAPGTPERPDRALVSPAARVVSGLLRDRFPRADPESSAFRKLRFALGTEAEYPTELVPLPEPTLPDRGLVLRAEFLVTESVSILTEEDELGDIGADVRLRLRWPRRAARGSASGDDSPPRSPGPAPQSPTTYTLVGNREVGSRRIASALKPELTRAAEDGWTRARLADAAYRVRRLYRDLGHHFVRVSAAADDGWAVFSIDEGPFVRLGSVRFSGNGMIPENALRGTLFSGTPRFVTTPFSRRLAAAQADSVRMHYFNEGFLNVRVGAPEFTYVQERRSMDVTIPVEEGPRFVLQRVILGGLPPSDERRIERLVSGETGEVLRASLPHRIAQKVRDHYREQGRPDARCSPRLDLDSERATGALELDVFAGTPTRVRKVKVVGNRKTTVAHIERLVDLDPGIPLATSKLQAAERRLIETGLFRSVRLQPVWPGDAPGLTPGAEDALADVEARVEEFPHLEAILSGGYGTFDGFRVGVDLGTRNAFGRGEDMHAGVEVSERGFRALAKAKFPLAGRRSDFITLTGIFESREQKSFEADYLGFSPSFSHRITRRDESRVGVRFDAIRTTEVAPGVPPGDLLDYENLVPYLTILSDRRDRYVNPHRGYVFAAQIEGSSSDWGSDVSYVRTSAFTAGYVPLTSDSTLALSIHGGVTKPQKDTDVLPIALRYFAGGIGTVRGIPDRELGPMVGGAPTGGEVFVAGTAEFRFRVWRNLFGAVFADRGGVFGTTDDVDIGDARSGYGVGLRYLTPVGFVVVDVGFNAAPRPGEDDSIVYLTFGLPF